MSTTRPRPDPSPVDPFDALCSRVHAQGMVVLVLPRGHVLVPIVAQDVRAKGRGVT